MFSGGVKSCQAYGALESDDGMDETQQTSFAIMSKQNFKHTRISMSSDFRFISTVYLRTFSQKFHFSDDYGTLGIK